MRKRAPYVYTTWKNASQKSNDVCGVYISFDNLNDLAADTPIKVTIPVKINLHQILMLASVRYLPSFCGRWEIELHPSAQNLVILPVPVENTIAHPLDPVIDLTLQTKDFTQLGKPFTRYNGYTTAQLHTPITVTCNEAILKQCLMNTTTFQLRFEVYEGLRQTYSEQPLIIPTNILTYGRFSGEPSNGTGNFHATLSQCLENCDSIFILVPFENGQHTCFYQPYLKDLRLSLGEFGTHPARYVQTWNDPRFLAMVLDSLNLETSEITAMNADVARSLNPEIICYHWGGTAHFSDGWHKTELKGDQSNFFIGISLSQVGFQSGTVSSPNTNVPFIFDAVVDRTGQHEHAPAINTSIIVMFLIDCALMIQVVQDSDVPIVKLTSKSIV
jgi:hypothetical protein